MSMEPNELARILLRERLRITAVATAIVRDVHAADDVFQQVVVAALERHSQFNDAQHVLAWGIQTARCRAIDSSHRHRAVSLPDEVLDLLEADWGDPSPDWSDQMEALQRCIGGLGGSARELLQMKYRDDLTAVVIADKLHRSPDAVYQSLSRIHRALRECVEQEMLRLESSSVKGGVP